MTDITELAQSLKAAAENATPGERRYLKTTPFMDAEISAENHTRVVNLLAGDVTEANSAFIALANPANIRALVEELEKAQRYIEELREWNAGLAQESFERQQRILELLEGKVGNALLERENHHVEVVGKLAERIAELESRTMMLPPELYTIGELIRTQDNRITDQPMFIVFQKREIIGSDEHSPSRICWVRDGEEVNPLRAIRLEILYQDGRDTSNYDRYAMQEVDEFVTACFTEHGCKEYLRQNGHNLRLPYIYACGSFRNNEYQLVRNWLAGIKVEAE